MSSNYIWLTKISPGIVTGGEWGHLVYSYQRDFFRVFQGPSDAIKGSVGEPTRRDMEGPAVGAGHIQMCSQTRHSDKVTLKDQRTYPLDTDP